MDSGSGAGMAGGNSVAPLARWGGRHETSPYGECGWRGAPSPVERPLHNYRLPPVYCSDQLTSTPRSYFESLSTSGPSPTTRGYPKVSSRERV